MTKPGTISTHEGRATDARVIRTPDDNPNTR